MIHIGRPRNSSEQASAIRLLLSAYEQNTSGDEAGDVLSLARNGSIDLSGLVGAWEGTTAVAVGLLIISPDGAAHVWPVEVTRQHPDRDAVAIAVTRRLTDLIDRAGCHFAQSLTDCERLDQRRALESSGFSHLADLILLECSLESSTVPIVHERIEHPVPFTEQSSERFAATIEQTYLDSLDCPGFMGIRTAVDALESYKSIGGFSPEQWWLVEFQRRDIGVILVNEWPERMAREIVYLGVIPEFRGKGIGGRLLTAVLERAKSDGFRSVLVTVDSANAPALRLYGQHGFDAKVKHAVFIRRQGGTQVS